MLKSLFRGIMLAGALTSAGAVLADGWVLDGAGSKLAFGSIKKDTVGEVHSFGDLSGSVDAQGAVTVRIGLPSVETLIDIRNERMIEHVFKDVTEATLSAQVDMAALDALPVGGTMTTDVEGVLTLLGRDVEVETEMFVARLGERKVLVSTSDMLFLGVEDAGLSAGVDMLQQLAKLPGITRTVPVTMRLIFESDGDTAQAQPVETAVQVAQAGDAVAGKKVFNKCKACHSLKPGKNSAGPSLHGVLGGEAATAAEFKYSQALKDSGIVWDDAQLAAFLADPKGTVPKTRMSFRGLKKSDDIENVIAYIRSQG